MKLIVKWKCYLSCRQGATGVEYALLAGILVLGLILAVTLLGDANQENFNSVAESVSSSG